MRILRQWFQTNTRSVYDTLCMLYLLFPMGLIFPNMSNQIPHELLAMKVGFGKYGGNRSDIKTHKMYFPTKYHKIFVDRLVRWSLLHLKWEMWEACEIMWSLTRLLVGRSEYSPSRRCVPPVLVSLLGPIL